MHTKGPWEIGHPSMMTVFGSHGFIGSDKVDQIVARCDSSIMFRRGATESELFHEAQANARLIAAAPDLLEACQLAIDQSTNRIVIGVLKNALKKATGE